MLFSEMISSSPDAAPQGGGTTVIGEYPELADAATVSWELQPSLVVDPSSVVGAQEGGARGGT